MDRCTLHVDVGYLIAEGGKAYCGAFRRSQVRCDHGAVAHALEDWARQQAGCPHYFGPTGMTELPTVS